MAFNALRFQDVARKQLVAYVKNFGLATGKDVQGMEKERAAQLLSEYLITQKIIVVGKKNLNALQRADVTKAKAF